MNKLIMAGAAALSFAVVAPASAQVTGQLADAGPNQLTLTNAGLFNGLTPVATLLGGTVYNGDQPFADRPAGTVTGGNFLAAGPTSGTSATLTFLNGGVSFLNFLWGSPDTYNVLTVNSTSGTQTFTATGLGFPNTAGVQTMSQYVLFSGINGTRINSVTFSNSPSINAFEAANFSITGPVPEPATWALMIAGFGLVGFAMRRRQNKITTNVRFA